MAAKPTTLTNREITKLFEGLRALDGTTGKDGAVERFELDDGLSWNAAKDRAIVERAFETYTYERKKIAAKWGVVDGMKLTPENAPNVAKFAEACEELLERTNELNGLLRFKKAELLKAGVNVPSILSNLMPLIDE